MSTKQATDSAEGDSQPEKKAKKELGFGGKLVRFFSSFGLAAAVMFLLLIVTFLGTVGQVEHGLYDSQQKYFNSFFFVGVLGIPIPFPGGFLLLIVLFINLSLGALIRVRKNWRGIGMVIAHSSILLLLAAGFVEFFFKKDGNMRLFEGQTADEFQSYHKWAVEIEEIPKDGNPVEREILVIPETSFRDLKGGKKRSFFKEGLPFEVVFSGYSRNSKVGSDGEGGVKMQPLALAEENEMNMPALTVGFEASGDKEIPSGLLWGGTPYPYVISADGREFAINLTKQTWAAPFALTLDKFTRELHPGTMKAKVFLSDVTKLEAGEEEKIKITMNEPLRHEGYTYFQASWGPPEAKPGEPLYSVFAVVHNPSDQWPLYSCVLVGVGLTIHFLIKLLMHLRRQTRLATREATASTNDNSTASA